MPPMMPPNQVQSWANPEAFEAGAQKRISVHTHDFLPERRAACESCISAHCFN